MSVLGCASELPTGWTALAGCVAGSAPGTPPSVGLDAATVCIPGPPSGVAWLTTWLLFPSMSAPGTAPGPGGCRLAPIAIIGAIIIGIIAISGSIIIISGIIDVSDERELDCPPY